MARRSGGVLAPGAENSIGVGGKEAPDKAYQFERADYGRMLADWEVIDDCIAGERVIKERGAKYLPPPEIIPPGLPATDPKVLRYGAYKLRAIFYNVAQRTLDGLVGEVFLRDPAVKVPPQLDAVIKDANGDGSSLAQTAKTALDSVMSKGRGGFFVDYPVTSGPVTVAQQNSGNIRPTIVFYKPTDIINWRKIKRGGKWILSLVVVREEYDAQLDDGFTTQTRLRWRALQLVNNIYVQTLYQPQETQTIQTFNIKDGKGNPLPEIPFTFVGSKNNGPDINPAPMLALCNLNLGHYRNSADYEESVFMLGQPTAVATGLTKQWVDEVLHGEVRVGARGGIPLPVGADLKIVQVEPNTLAKEAMDSKEKQMQALGAKLVEIERSVQQTATEAEINSSAETSVLQSCAGNVEAAIKWALEWCGIFVGVINFADDATVRGSQITYEINSDFDIMRMTWQDRQQLLKEWQANAITTSEYRDNIRRAGIGSLDTEEFEVEQQEDITKSMDQQAELIKMQAAASTKNEGPSGTGATGGN